MAGAAPGLGVALSVAVGGRGARLWGPALPGVCWVCRVCGVCWVCGACWVGQLGSPLAAGVGLRLRFQLIPCLWLLGA